jgi:protein-tyrosine phosphatase
VRHTAGSTSIVEDGAGVRRVRTEGASDVHRRRRALAIPPIPNLRDVGGYPTRSGWGSVRTGLLYRSSGLHALAPADDDAIARLAIRTVYDLRLAREQAEASDRLPAGTRHLPLDVLGAWTEGGPSRLFAWAEDPAAARDALGNGGAEALWVEQYRALVRLPSARTGYGTLFRDLAVASHRPALVHCTTGKDRTGWVVAALQLLLGVPEDAVMDHFLESRRHIGPLVEPALAAIAARGGDPELFRPLLDVRPSYLEAALDEVRGTYGPIERYFSDGLGVDEVMQEALRTAFTG